MGSSVDQVQGTSDDLTVNTMLSSDVKFIPTRSSVDNVTPTRSSDEQMQKNSILISQANTMISSDVKFMPTRSSDDQVQGTSDDLTVNTMLSSDVKFMPTRSSIDHLRPTRSS